MEYPYDGEALKFLHKRSPVILDASSVSKMPVNPPNLKDNRSKICTTLCQKENMQVLKHFSYLELKDALKKDLFSIFITDGLKIPNSCCIELSTADS